MNIDMPWYGLTSGFVTTMTMWKEANSALELNHFSPLMTQWSPSRTAREVNRVGSAPPCGSVIT